MNLNIKKSLLLILLLLGFIGVTKILIANNDQGEDFYQKRFREANEYYQQNKFKKALAEYQELLEMEIEDAALYYNVANTYVQLGQNGRAVWMYEKAARLDPRNEFIEYNLAKISPKENNPEAFVLFVPFKNLTAFISLNEWTMIVSGIWIALALFIALLNFLESEFLHRYVKFFSYVGAILFLVSLLFLMAKYRDEQGSPKAIVLGFVDTHSGPSMEFKKQLSLPAGRKVIVRGEEDGWTEIAIPGEVPRTYIKSEKLGKI